MVVPRTIELSEYQTQAFPAEVIPEAVARHLWSRYREKITLELPTFQTDNQWKLTSQGWVGHIPITEDFHVLLKPKVELGNLFRMLEYAYRVQFETMGNIIGASSLSEFYERLARILALRVTDRTRKGLYREYLQRAQRLPYVRGRISLESMITRPWEVDLDCQYNENTSDIEDNKILAWTLFCIARSGLCSEEGGKLIRRAYRGMRGFCELRCYDQSACQGRLYNRLNEDYNPLHGLCRFFLENTGPTHEKGEYRMLPFLVDMAKLFETFVAEWLRQNLPQSILMKDQATIQIGFETKVDFRIDLLLTERITGRALCILDTKYKSGPSPSSDDLQQVIAYAKACECKEAILVYPHALEHPFEGMVGDDIRVRTTAFTLSGDLEANGSAFLKDLMNVLRMYRSD